jgi:hypothetical protein
MKLPKYFLQYSIPKGQDYVITGILCFGAVLLGRLMLQRMRYFTTEQTYISVGLLLLMLCIALYFGLRGSYSSSILLKPSGVKFKSGIVAYSQYSHISASFAYQQITLIRKENASSPIVLRFPEGHQGRVMLYSLSAGTSIPVQEDHFSSSLRQPNGRIIADPMNDLENEMDRQESKSHKGGVSLVVRKGSDWIQITTPVIQRDRIIQNSWSLFMLIVGAYFFYIFFRELKIIDIWFYNLGLAISGSGFMTFLAVLAFGYPIFESLTERIELTVTPTELTLRTIRGLKNSTQHFRLSSVIGIVIQQVGWTDGLGLAVSKPIFDCLLLTDRDTIQMGSSSVQCHQWQGLLSTAIDELGYRNSY